MEVNACHNEAYKEAASFKIRKRKTTHFCPLFNKTAPKRKSISGLFSGNWVINV